MYHHVMDCINSVFEDALGRRIEREGPVALGASTSTAHGGPIPFNSVQPVLFFMEQAYHDYLRANEERLSSLATPEASLQIFTTWQFRRYTGQLL